MKTDANSVKPALVSVLVVDDDEMVRNIIVQQLKAIGFQKFYEAGNGSEAIKYILDPLHRVDMIICDWEMPKTDGITLLRAVRAHRHHAQTPFIMVTSQQSQERLKISQAKKHEVNAYIVKPFRAETLRAKVYQVLIEAMEKKTIAA